MKTNCQNDPRVHWRGASIGVDGNGDMSWYRMDNFDNKEDPVVSSAYEYVIPTNNGFVMISDELMGFGFATYALGIVWHFWRKTITFRFNYYTNYEPDHNYDYKR